MKIRMETCTVLYAGLAATAHEIRLNRGGARRRLFHRVVCVVALASIVTLPTTVAAQASTYSQPVGADTFVSSGQPDTTFGIRGAMEIAAPTAAQPRTLLTLMWFDTAGLQASFDADFGAGNWTVTSVTLTLFSSVASAGQQPANGSFNRIAAGGFEFDLLGNNNWNENAITWNTLPAILPGAGSTNTLTSLGNYFWPASGAGSSTWALANDPALAQKIQTGDAVTILGQPTVGSTVGYLINTSPLRPGFLNVTAEAVPEPATLPLIAGFLCAAMGAGLRGRKKH